MENLLPKFYYRCKIQAPRFGSFTTCLLVAQTAKAVLVAGSDPFLTTKLDRQCSYRPAWIPRACILIDPVPLIECSRCHGLVPKPRNYNHNKDDNRCPPCQVANTREALETVMVPKAVIDEAIKKIYLDI